MRKLIAITILALAMAACQPDASTQSQQPTAPDTTQPAPDALYKNPQAPINERVSDLLRRMTLSDKIGQMTQMCFSTITLNGSKSLSLDANKFRDAITEQKVGSFLSGSDSAAKWVEFITALQKIALNETRLGIPLIIGIDHVHGSNYVYEGTIYPHNINIGCTFNTKLAAQCASQTAQETACLGLSWNFAPVCDIGKNPYWPRHYETFGEDPYLCATMAAGFITAYQDTANSSPYGLAACAKHFVGYSDPYSGWDRTPSLIPMQTLWEEFIPPFKSAFEAGVKTIMVNSGELNGQPVHASHPFLTELLRQKLGFDGVILTDIKDIYKIIELHHAAHNEAEATEMAINAGIDMSMACNSYEFVSTMKQLVAEKRIPMARINDAVSRILKLKFELGLFEHPMPNAQKAKKIIGNNEHKQTAQKAAQEGMVLLKNQNNTLPLNKPNKILVVGNAANSKRLITGPWTFEWLGATENKQPGGMKTIYQALVEKMPHTQVSYIDSVATKNLKLFKTLAASTNAIVIAAGETPYSEFKGNAHTLELPPHQQQLVRLAHQTGKPVILVLLQGRPRIIKPIEPYTHAIVYAGWPGQMGGQAIANMLNGANNWGKLAFSYPLAVGHFAPYYHKPSEKYFQDYNKKSEYQYPFGHGLSYTQFKYHSLTVSDTVFSNPDKNIVFTVQVTNQGKVTGSEVALWYFTDHVGRITRPVKKLFTFEKAQIKPANTYSFVAQIKPSEVLTYPDANGNPIIEKGTYTIQVGTETIKLRYE